MTEERKTASGISFTLKNDLTGADFVAWREVMLSHITLNTEGKAGGEIPAVLVARLERKAIEIAITSLDGSTENIFERSQSYPFADYNELASAAMSIVDKLNNFLTGKKNE